MRGGIAGLSPDRPLEVRINQPSPVHLVRIAAVVPCFNRRTDAEAVLEDLARVDLAGPDWHVELRVLLVDNASDVPLSGVTGSWTGKRPGEGGLRLEHLRSETNTGGSGGYNLGIARALSSWEHDDGVGAAGWDPEYIWLVDSDARVAPSTLAHLLEVMERDDTIVGAGSVICDPLTSQAFELGGNQNPRTGHFEPMVLGQVGVVGSADGLVDCDYVAACCALVRTDAIRATGLFPDRFLNADDVEWFIRMKQRTGGRIVGVPASVAMHPRFDRFPTWTRYYMCRNALGPLEAVGGGARARAVRVKQEVLRAVQQSVMGRMDLANLHIRALKDAAAHNTVGMAAPGVIKVEPVRPWSKLRSDLERELGASAKGASAWVLNDLQLDGAAHRDMNAQLDALSAERPWKTPKREDGLARSLVGAMGRLIFGPRADIAVVPARGRPAAWLSGRVIVQATPQGYVLRRFGRTSCVFNALRTLIAGAWHGARCVVREPEFRELPGAPRGPAVPDATDVPIAYTEAAKPRVLSLTVVVLSHNRWDSLASTLRSLLADPTVVNSGADCGGGSAGSIVVVDNCSTDGTPEKLASEFPGVETIALDQNLGVEAFNIAVGSVRSELVLILDDDARVERRALRDAVERMTARPELGAVAFLPRHPGTGRAEWSFGERDDAAHWTSDRWPVMGCANLVRQSDWIAAGGYEPSFFLYRNDTDLALKLLAMGRCVHFDSTWIALHDTPAGAGSRKSVRWHHLATRNWMWVCRRHGRGLSGAGAMAAGLVWSHKLAGPSITRQAATLRGAVTGLLSRAPGLSLRAHGIAPDGSHLAQLVSLRLNARKHRRLL